jgi:hypothetical protein
VSDLEQWADQLENAIDRLLVTLDRIVDALGNAGIETEEVGHALEQFRSESIRALDLRRGMAE